MPRGMQPCKETGSAASPARISREKAQEEMAPTWEAIIIDVTEGGHALPKVCVVCAVTIQDKLLFQHSLASRK